VIEGGVNLELLQGRWYLLAVADTVVTSEVKVAAVRHIMWWPLGYIG